MTNKVSFIVTLDFESSIKGIEQSEEVGRKVADAIQFINRTKGLAPNGSDNFLNKISVSGRFTNTTIRKV